MTDKRVLRHTLTINDTPQEVPAGVPVLFGRTQRNQLPGLEARVDAWFEVSTPDDWPKTPHTGGTQQVQIVGTGHAIPETWRWLASFIDGPLVWHLYKVRP